MGCKARPFYSDRARNFRAVLKKVGRTFQSISQTLPMMSCIKSPLFFSQQHERFCSGLAALAVPWHCEELRERAAEATGGRHLGSAFKGACFLSEGEFFHVV